MYKKSILVVMIQFGGVLLGIVSLYLVVGDMAPEVYSLMGVLAIISGIILTFSDLGIETTMMREALYWIQNGEEEKVKEHTTQALMSRALGFILLIPPLIVYSLYLCYAKYEGMYFPILLSFIIGSVVSAFNDSMSLVVRAQGGYVFSQAAKVANTYFSKIGGVALYFAFGATPYLLFNAFVSVPLMIIFIVKVRKSLNFRYFIIKDMLKKIWKAKFLWLKTDLDYFKNNADSVLVSILFTSAILGAYTIFKTLENISKTFIEGFFDVLSQESVRNKGNKEVLIKLRNKFRKVAFLLCFLIFWMLLVFSIKPEFFVEILHLSKYEGMIPIVYCVGIISIIHLVSKYEINMVSFFASSKTFFFVGLANFVGAIVSFAVVAFFPSIVSMLSQRIVVYLIAGLISVIVYQKNKEKMFSKIME